MFHCLGLTLRANGLGTSNLIIPTTLRYVHCTVSLITKTQLHILVTLTLDFLAQILTGRQLECLNKSLKDPFGLCLSCST